MARPETRHRSPASRRGSSARRGRAIPPVIAGLAAAACVVLWALSDRGTEAWPVDSRPGTPRPEPWQHGVIDAVLREHLARNPLPEGVEIALRLDDVTLVDYAPRGLGVAAQLIPPNQPSARPLREPDAPPFVIVTVGGLRRPSEGVARAMAIRSDVMRGAPIAGPFAVCGTVSVPSEIYELSRVEGAWRVTSARWRP